MKNCTKLHFYRYDDGVKRTITDFFLGGALLFESGTVKYVVNDTEYILDENDQKLFIDTTHTFTQTDPTTQEEHAYAPILPIYDAYSLKQNLECRCSIILGELPYNSRFGIPLKSQNTDKQLAVVNIINGTPGVLQCTVNKVSIINKKITMDITIVSSFGEFNLAIG